MDGGVPVVVTQCGDEVDAGVRTALSPRPLGPEPNVGEARRPLRVVEQVGLDEPLELVTLVALIKRLGAEVAENLINRRSHATRVCLTDWRRVGERCGPDSEPSVTCEAQGPN